MQTRVFLPDFPSRVPPPLVTDYRTQGDPNWVEIANFINSLPKLVRAKDTFIKELTVSWFLTPRQALYLRHFYRVDTDNGLNRFRIRISTGDIVVAQFTSPLDEKEELSSYKTITTTMLFILSDEALACENIVVELLYCFTPEELSDCAIRFDQLNSNLDTWITGQEEQPANV